MVKSRTRSVILVGGLLALLVGLLGVTLLVARTVLAQTATPEATTPDTTTPSDEDSDAPLMPFGHMGRGSGMGHFGRGAVGDEYLAAALGISVEELQAAQDSAYAAYLADAVAAGDITQAQADGMLAMRRLSAYIDHQSLVAEALGMSVDELQAALADGQSLADLMTAKGLTAETLQANLQTAYEAAIARAVADGVITQAPRPGPGRRAAEQRPALRLLWPRRIRARRSWARRPGRFPPPRRHRPGHDHAGDDRDFLRGLSSRCPLGARLGHRTIATAPP